VQAETGSGLDWRDAAAYAPLLEADRSLFAWEWLRRDTDYRAAACASKEGARAASPPPERFGLIRFESPHLAVPAARPLWSSDVHPYVLGAEATRPCPTDDSFHLEPLQGLARLVIRDHTEHLLLSDGLRAVRLDGSEGAFSRGPAHLRYALGGVSSAEPPLLTLRRFLALCRTGAFARSLHRREARARRWILLLRACDALAAGADQRQIAEEVLSRSVAEPRWRSRESSIRSQVQRLVRSARRMTAGGYRKLLLPPGYSAEFSPYQYE
jgi:hypothetical protein